MNRSIAVISVFAAALIFAGSILGCGTSTSSSTTTTLSSGAKAGQNAGDAVTAALGIAAASQSTGDLAGLGGGVGASSALSLKAFQAPPDAFFDPLPSDGWMEFTPPGMPSGQTARFKIYTRSGQVINGAFLTGKNIATFEGFEWQQMVTAEGISFMTIFGPAAYKWITVAPAWSGTDPTAQANFYSSSSKFRGLVSFWDYIVWAHIASHPSMEVAVNVAYTCYNDYTPPTPHRSPLSLYPKRGTPEAVNNDKMGSQEVIVTGTDPHGGTVNFTCSVSTDAEEGRPVSQIGSGTITRPDGVTMEVEFAMDFVDGAPSSGTMHLRIPAPDNLHIIMTMYASGSAEGDVYTTAETPERKIGKIVIFETPDSSGHYGYYEDLATGTKEYFS